MTPTYQDHVDTANPQASSSSSHHFTYPIQDRGGCYRTEVHQLNYQLEATNFGSQVGSHDDPTPENESDHGLKVFLWKKVNGHENNQSDQNGSAPSSLPLGTGNSSNSSSSNFSIPIRVCADCNTTKTPLWRSGPTGPKSLCNACGIRQRKARRAMAAAANGTILAAEISSPAKTNKVQHKDKRSNGGHAAKYKKRTSKLATTTSHGRKNCFEDFLISLSKNSAFHRVFPQDEKEAAILLMALSCGLVHG